MFKAELMDALRIVERGDIAPQEMRGAWAGEIGQTQFMPSSYIKFAVDFDGDGRRDLLREPPDVLAWTAELPRRPWLAKEARMGDRQRQFAVIKEWNKSQVYAKTVGFSPRSFRARLEQNNSKGRSQVDRPFSRPIYFAVPTCIALLRYAAQTPALPLSSASWAAAISFCGGDLPLTVSHVLDHRFSLAQIVAAAGRFDSRGVGGRDGICQRCYRSGCE